MSIPRELMARISGRDRQKQPAIHSPNALEGPFCCSASGEKTLAMQVALLLYRNAVVLQKPIFVDCLDIHIVCVNCM
jgi:hypothetical protein